MKLLIISWYFPPANTIAAVRIGNLARFLSSRGHDVKVLAGKDLPHPQTLKLDLSASEVLYAKGFDINDPPRLLSRMVKSALRAISNSFGGKGARRSETLGGRAQTPSASPTQGRISSLYMHAINIPDSRVGWLPSATWIGRRALSRWRPDFVFSSGPPFTTLFVGHLLGKMFGVPHVVEFRDRWFDDPYFVPPPWRVKIDQWLEMIIVKRALAISTVSEPWAETYRERHGKPVAVVYNGHDRALVDVEPAGWPDPDTLRIVYTGGIYPGFRDPTALFTAIGRLGETAKKIRVDFYGTEPTTLRHEIDRFGVQASVSIWDGVTHKEALKIQREADILYLLQWNNPKEQGNVPGKFFEYLGARRPILLSGYDLGVPAKIIRERGAGFVSNDPDKIEKQLKIWLEQKSKNGMIEALSDEACRGFSRDEQYRALETFLTELMSDTNRP